MFVMNYRVFPLQTILKCTDVGSINVTGSMHKCVRTKQKVLLYCLTLINVDKVKTQLFQKFQYN